MSKIAETLNTTVAVRNLTTVSPIANSDSADKKEDLENALDMKRWIPLMCHEIRNTLSGIYGNTDLITKDMTEQETLLNSNDCRNMNKKLQKEFLSLIEKVKSEVHIIKICAEHQKMLINDFLNFSKLQGGKLELNIQKTEPLEVANEVLVLLKTEIAQKKIQIFLKFPHQNICIQTDKERLRQILLNLVSNAIKFTNPQGKITIGCSNFIEELNANMIKISVEDDGIGMTEQEMKNLFQPYVQGSPKISAQYGGSGLGLSICKLLTERMGGKIEVKSEKGQGSTFTFSIRSEAPQFNLSTLQPIFSNMKKNQELKKEVLIVDDGIVNQKVLKCILENKYTCFIASNGKEAVDLSLNKRFDYILMDLNMPIMSGFEAIQLIRKNEGEKMGNSTKKSIIILLSATDITPAFQKTAQDMGFDDCICKPFNRETLVKKMEMLHEKHFSSTRRGRSLSF